MALLYNVVGLSKSFIKERQPIAVLKGVHFQLEEQEALVVLGASGAGKSTLLHLLGTLDTPTAGQVFYRGEELFLKNDKQLSEFRNNKISGEIFGVLVDLIGQSVGVAGQKFSGNHNRNFTVKIIGHLLGLVLRKRILGRKFFV